MLLSQVKQINPLLNPKPVELGIGSYAGTEGSQANTNLSNISNVLPFALPMATMGLMSQAPNIINKEISAQDVIDNHLNRDVNSTGSGYIFTPPEQEIVNTELPFIPPEYQTYDESFVTPDSRVVDQGFITPDTQFQDEGFITPSSVDMTTLYNKGLLEDEVIDDGLLSEKAPPFYSKITKTIEDAQMNKASGDGWMGMINNSGVNQDELDWIGMKDFLADKKSVTKEEILDFARMNDLSTEVKEVILGETNNPNTNVIKKNTNAIDVSLVDVEDYDDATLIVMNNERLYNEFQDFLADTKADLQVDEIDSLVEDDYLEEFLRAKGVSKQKSTLPTIFNDTNLITEGDYTDYKEMTFALPNIDADFTGGHYKDKNIFAHARFNTRDIDGKKTLFIEELQSDWVHKGKDAGFKDDNKYQELRKEQQRLFEVQINIGKDIKEQGFDGTAEQQKIYMDAANASKEIQNELNATSDAVPDLPFKKNWQDIVLKRMIRYAAENGFDAIAMTGGNIQKDRYDLSKHIDTLSYNETTGSINGYKDGESVLFKQDVTKDNLADYVGKEVAKKIQEAEYEKITMEGAENVKMKRLSGLDLQVGGEGLGEMYDKIFNKSLKKIGKKHGAEIESKQLNDKLNMWYMNLTDSLKKQSIEAGMPIAFNKPVNPLFNYA